jgi:hypothetical protein
MKTAPSPAERTAAIAALRQIRYRDRSVFEELSRSMRDDLNNEVRQAAAAALLDYEGNPTIERIEAFMDTEQGEDARRAVCAELASAPAQRSNPGATGILTARLALDPSPAVRLAAAASLLARGDRVALGALKTASEKDPAAAVRQAAQDAWRALSRPVKVQAPKPRPQETADYNAVKGQDRCPVGLHGWCECSRGFLKTKPRCVSRDVCAHMYFNSYQNNGYSCNWNGALIE